MLNLRERLVGTVTTLASDDEHLSACLHTIARLGKHIAPGAAQRRQLDHLQWAVEHNHSSVQLIHRIVSDTSPSYLGGLVKLFVNHAWDGRRQRRQFEREHGLFPPSFVVISPLAACNLRCVGCYAGAYADREPTLSYSDIERIVAEVREWGCRFIVISGGEPLLFWRKMPGDERGLRDLLRQYDDMVFLMYTNGTLIDRETAAEMAEMGNISPALSLEGFREQTDARRGEGVFDRIMDRMDTLREAEVLFGASVTYTRSNIEPVTDEQFIDMLIDKGCVYAWYFMYVPVGRSPDLDLMVTPEERKHVAETTWRWLTTRPIFVADFWNSGGLTQGCIAAGRPNGYMHINHRGEITPCVFIMYSAHNIHETESETPLLDAVKSEFFARIRRGQEEREHNPLAPCQIVDHPEVLKEAVETTGAHSTQEGQRILTDLHPLVMERSRVWQHIADDMWTRSGRYKGLAPEYTNGRWLRPG